MAASYLLMALAFVALPNAPGPGKFAPGRMILECVVSTHFEGYPDGFATPDETIRLEIDVAARTLAYWDPATSAYVAAPETALADWAAGFRFGDGVGGLTEIAADGSRYRNVTTSSDGRAETTGPCRPAG